MNEKRERQNVIIPITWDRAKGTYIIEVTEPLLGEFQKLLIDGGKEKNIGIFFTVEEKRLTREESINKTVELAKRILEKEKQSSKDEGIGFKVTNNR